MKKTFLTAIVMWLSAWFAAGAQVTSQPTPLQEDSEDVVIFFHADEGNKGLAGMPASSRIYAHTGVLTSSSSSGSDWKYAPSWGDNSEKYRLEYVSENLWKLEIGDIRTYYGVSDPAERIKKLAFVFRTADCSKEGKGAGNSDIFLDVHDAGLQVSLESGLDGYVVTPATATVRFSLGSTKAADLEILVDGGSIAKKSGVTLLETDYTFPGPGSYTVTGKATADGETKEVSYDYLFINGSPEADYPGGKPVMGTVRNSDGSVTFCIAAPGKNSVVLVGSWNGYSVGDGKLMNYTDVDGFRYFWTTVEGLDAHTAYCYYYLVDAVTRVGDPYAKLVLDPDNDKYIPEDVYPGLPQYPYDLVEGVPLAVYQEDLNDYDWKVTDFKGVHKDNLIIYELLFRDFTGTEGKALGNGTVRDAIAKIPYLKRLGVNAVELLPITEFNGNNSWGYNPNFYFAPDKAYGTPDDYKEFIDICHQNGIAVILDMVFNQSDWQHPWYRMYEPGSNPFYNVDAPHAYSVLNDWNQGYGLVQKQWHDVLRYWIEEYKVDGYRFDLVKGLGDNDSYANAGDAATNAYNSSRVDRMKALQEVVLSVKPDAYFINENLAGAKEENEMAATGQLNWANVNNEGCQFAMGYSSDSNLNRMYAPYNDGRTWGSTVSYLESHDEQRLAYKQDVYGEKGVNGDVEVSCQRLGSAAAQMLMAPGAHMIWQFSELGNYDNTKNADGGNNTDPKPVRWKLFDNEYRHGLYTSYAELAAIRNNNPELFTAEASYVGSCAAVNWTAGRTMTAKADGKELYTVINPNVSGEITVTVNFEKGNDSDYQILSKSYGSAPSFSASQKRVIVPANCYVVVGSASLLDVEDIVTDRQDFDVNVADGCITVDCNGVCEIYDASGIRVYAGVSGASVSVSPGLYIVRAAGTSRKVIVR